MKKRLLTVLLAVCLVVALGTVTAMADDTALPDAVNGVITLEDDYNLGTSRVEISENVSVIDLNGHKITGLLNVTHQLTIRDTSAEADGVIVAPNGEDTLISTIYVLAGGNLTIESGTIQAAEGKGRGAIRNMGTLTINGGTVTGVYGIRSGAQLNNKPIYTDVSLTINGGVVHGDEYGIYTFGRGIVNGNVDTVDNDQVTLTITGGRVECGTNGTAIGTNASGGKYAGYTFTMTDGVIDGGATGTGLYLPAIGVNNISGGTITGDQAIRIASGTLNITGGMITSTGSNTDDIIAGGTGGASGALVIGKAGTGYVGDLIVNVSGSTQLINTNNSANPTAVFVTDKTMNDSSYDDVVIEVNINNIEITGDIVRASDLNSSGEQTNAKGSTTTLNISETSVTGNLINKSTNGNVLVDGSKISGYVSAENSNSVSVNNSDLGSTNGDNIVFAGDSTVGGQVQEPSGVAMVNGKIFTSLTEAINAASNGDTITLVGNVDETINLVITGKNLTIEGNGHTITTEVGGGATSIGVQLVRSSLTLNNVDWTFTPNENGGTAIDVQNNGSELTLNNSTVTINGTKRGMVMSATAGSDENLAKIKLNSSALNVLNVSGNASNGGDWTVTNSTIKMSNIGNHALSVESIVIDNSVVDISDVGYCGIMGKDVELKNGSDVSVTESGKVLPYPNDGTSSTWAPDGETYKRAVEIKKNGSIDVNNSTLVLSNNKNSSGEPINVIYISEGSELTTSGNYSIVADIESVATETQYYTVTYVSNNSLYTSKIVSSEDNTHKLLTAPTRNGYTFGGWRYGNTVYKAGETVKVTSDMTFTAIWNAINIPDTYDIDLIVGEGGEAKTNFSNASAGTTITVTVTPDDGYELDYITVDGERISGTSFKMPDHDVTVRVYFTDGTSTLPFTDVSANQWFYDAVAYVYTNGMMEGDSATTFNPDGQMTRAMFWAVLGRIDGATITGANWVETARSWAMAEGVSDGTNPNDYVTREMMVTMLWRYAGEPASDESLSGYSDAASVSDWAAEAMSWALETGVIEGVTATTLQPQGTATRAQCATIFMRYDMI